MGPNEITDKFAEIYEPRISPRNAGFLNEMRKANPAGAELLDRNAAKANIAMVARGMRVAIQITQEQLSERSGLTQALISRIEAPTGSMPTIETLMKYVEGFGGHLGLLFGSEVSERPVTSATKVKKHVMTIGERLAKVKMAGNACTKVSRNGIRKRLKMSLLRNPIPRNYTNMPARTLRISIRL